MKNLFLVSACLFSQLSFAVKYFDMEYGTLERFQNAAQQVMARHGDSVAQIDYRYFDQVGSLKFTSGKGYDCEAWQGWTYAPKTCIKRHVYKVNCAQRNHIEYVYASTPPIKECRVPEPKYSIGRACQPMGLFAPCM